MPENTQINGLIEAEEPEAQSEDSASGKRFRSEGAGFAARLGWLPGTTHSSTFTDRTIRVRATLRTVYSQVEAKFKHSPTDDLRWLRDNGTLIFSELGSVGTEVKPLKTLPHIRTPKGKVIPRAFALAKYFIDTADYQYTDQSFSEFCLGFQQNAVLNLRELWALAPALKLALLEQIAGRGRKALQAHEGEDCGIGACVRSLREVVQTPWKDVLEPLI